MHDPNGKSHIAHASLHGPAERTLIEPWLGEHAALMTNAYPDQHPDPCFDEHPGAHLAPLATVTALQTPPAPRRVLAA